GDEFPINFCVAMKFPDIAALLLLDDMELHAVARHDRLAKAGVVDRHEINKVRAALGLARTDRASRLRHALDEQNARHDRMLGEMPGELRLVDRYVLDADSRLVPVDLDDLVDQQERVTMGKQRKDLP